MDKTGIDLLTMEKLGKDMSVSKDVLGRIYKVLDCSVEDIVDFL